MSAASSWRVLVLFFLFSLVWLTCFLSVTLVSPSLSIAASAFGFGTATGSGGLGGSMPARVASAPFSVKE